MSRPADPKRIVHVRDAIRNTLTGSGMWVETAERWCDAWEIESAGSGLRRDGCYRQVGSEWIATERAARRPGW